MGDAARGLCRSVLKGNVGHLDPHPAPSATTLPLRPVLADAERDGAPEELSMTSLRIHHRTTYRYRHAVAFGPHRLMLRPRESRDLRLIGFEMVVTPAGNGDMGT